MVLQDRKIKDRLQLFSNLLLDPFSGEEESGCPQISNGFIFIQRFQG